MVPTLAHPTFYPAPTTAKYLLQHPTPTCPFWAKLHVGMADVDPLLNTSF